MNAILECNCSKRTILEKMCIIMFTILALSIHQINAISVPKDNNHNNTTTNQTIANATNSIKASASATPIDSINYKIIKLNELYNKTLLSFPTLPECSDLIAKLNRNRPEMDAVSCILYYDMLENLNKTDISDFNTTESIQKKLDEFDEKKNWTNSFCDLFGNELPTDNGSTLFEKTFLSGEVGKALSSRFFCSELCHEKTEELHISLKCKLISVVYAAINRHSKSKDNVEIKTSEVKTKLVKKPLDKPLENKSTRTMTNTSISQIQKVSTKKEETAQDNDEPNQPPAAPLADKNINPEKLPETPAQEENYPIEDNQDPADLADPADPGYVGGEKDNDEDKKQNEMNKLLPQSNIQPIKTISKPATYRKNENDLLETENADSNFFSYFMFLMFISVVFYVIYHNKTKVLALMLEGRRSRSGRSRRKPHSAEYRKLESNLEEAIQSNNQVMNQQVIY